MVSIGFLCYLCMSEELYARKMDAVQVQVSQEREQLGQYNARFNVIEVLTLDGNKQL